jgi:hypothetical protein
MTIYIYIYIYFFFLKVLDFQGETLPEFLGRANQRNGMVSSTSGQYIQWLRESGKIVD